jgi:glucokinase
MEELLMILAGDIGGTNTRLAFFEVEGDRLVQGATEVYSSREHHGLEEIVQRFVAIHRENPSAACFGVACAAADGICRTPNLPWVVDARVLAADLGIEKVGLINDLEANAHGISMLEKDDLCVLCPGQPNRGGNAALISAGTGLGEAGLHWEGDCYQPFASEGGHTDFAPRNALEIELLEYLLETHERVSYERVLSGPGLVGIYEFLLATGRGQEPSWLATEISSHDPAAAISKAGLDGRADICTLALDTFVSIYGAEAGNLALKMLATGGVFLGGGIAPKILGKLKEPIFREAFLAKGRMRPLLESVPVQVIVNERTALLGAARVAQHGSRAC